MNGRRYNQKICSELIGWGRGRVVRERDNGIIDGGGRGGWFGAWNGGGHSVGGLGAVVEVAVGTRGACREGRGARGLQLLATTVSSSLSLSSSVRIWKGLLCRVRCWCTIGNQQIVPGVVMVFDVIATLRGAATATLGGGVVSTLGDVGRGGRESGWMDIVVDSWQIAARCLNLVRWP